MTAGFPQVTATSDLCVLRTAAALCLSSRLVRVDIGGNLVRSDTRRQRSYSAIELMKLPLAERLMILSSLSGKAEQVYSTDKELTDFEAFGDDDLFDETP